MQIKFVVDGHIQVSRNLRLLAQEVPRLRQPFNECVDLVAARTDNIFKAQGSNVAKAGTWPALSAKTLHAREKRWGYYKKTPSRPGILRWTGALQDQVLRQSSDTEASLEHVAKSPKGFNYPLAHQRGDGSAPQRVIIDIDEPTIVEMQRVFQVHFHDLIGIFGLQA